MKRYESGRRTQVEKGPAKAGIKPKGNGGNNRRSRGHLHQMGAGSAHPSRTSPRSPERKTGRHSKGVRVTYECVPRLPLGLDVTVTGKKWHVRANCKNWKSLWRMAKVEGAEHPLKAVLIRAGLYNPSH